VRFEPVLAAPFLPPLRAGDGRLVPAGSRPGPPAPAERDRVRAWLV